jgi:hypothetical protein
MSLSAHDPLIGLGTLVAKVKQQRRGFSGLFGVGVGWLFLEIEAGKGTRLTRILRCRVRFRHS